MSETRSGDPGRAPIILAYDTIKDPRDLAEVLHLAAGFGTEVHLLGESLPPNHWKVLRKLRSWRPRLAEKPEEITVTRFGSVADWARSMRAEGFSIVGTAIEGGALPWSTPGSSPGPPLAILFGEETKGLSKDALLHCDRLWTLPLGQGGRFYTLGQATAAILGGMKK